MMSKNILGVILSFLYFFLIIFLSKLLFKKRGEMARKFVHIMIGNWWLILLALITETICALIVPTAFVFINYYSVTRDHKNGLLANLERKKGEKAFSSYGLILYPISLVIMVVFSYVLTNKHYLGGVGLIVLAYGDGCAALIGKKWPYGKYCVGRAKKTFSGSLSMFLISSIILLVYLSIIVGFPIGEILSTIFLTATLSTVAEAITPNGFDNISVPITALVTYLFGLYYL